MVKFGCAAESSRNLTSGFQNVKGQLTIPHYRITRLQVLLVDNKFHSVFPLPFLPYWLKPNKKNNSTSTTLVRCQKPTFCIVLYDICTYVSDYIKALFTTEFSCYKSVRISSYLRWHLITSRTLKFSKRPASRKIVTTPTLSLSRWILDIYE